MIQRFLRQRRRLALMAVVGALAGLAVGYGNIVLAIIAGAAGSVLATCLVLATFPILRWHVLKVFLIIIALGLIARTGEPFDHRLVLAGLAGAALLLVPSQFHWLDRIQLPTTVTAAAERLIDMTPETLWEYVFPKATDAHWDPALAGIRGTKDPLLFYFIYVARDYDSDTHIPVRIFDVEDGTHFKMRDMSLPDASEGGPIIVTSHVLEPEDGSVRLKIMEASWHPGLWTAFSNWMEDHMGDHLDRISAVLEDRADFSVIGSHLRRFHS